MRHMAVQAVPRRFIGAAFQAALAQCLSMANRQVALAMVFPVAGLRMQGRRPLSSAIEKAPPNVTGNHLASHQG